MREFLHVWFGTYVRASQFYWSVILRCLFVLFVSYVCFVSSFVCLFICLFVCLFVCLFICLIVCLFVCSVCLFVCLFCLFVYNLFFSCIFLKFVPLLLSIALLLVFVFIYFCQSNRLDNSIYFMFYVANFLSSHFLNTFAVIFIVYFSYLLKLKRNDGWHGNQYQITSSDEAAVVVANGTFYSGFSAVESICGLTGCYRLQVTEDPTVVKTITDTAQMLLNPPPSFWSACGYKGTCFDTCI